MRTTIAMLILVQCVADVAQAASEGWLTDFEQAQAQAKETRRPILVNFSGSDWCGWCIKLDKEVLQESKFKSYAKDNLVLFNAGFPRKKALPEKEAKQNQGLAERYSIEGFPTVLLLDTKGAVIARTGYRPGGPTGYVEHLSELIAAHKTEASGAESAAGATTPKTPKSNEYDAENDRYWNADHGHWHPGRPPAGYPK